MSAPRFRVTGLSEHPNTRGEGMRLVTLVAMDGEAFQTGENSPPADGAIRMLVTPEYAKELEIGSEFALEARQ